MGDRWVRARVVVELGNAHCQLSEYGTTFKIWSQEGFQNRFLTLKSAFLCRMTWHSITKPYGHVGHRPVGDVYSIRLLIRRKNQISNLIPWRYLITLFKVGDVALCNVAIWSFQLKLSWVYLLDLVRTLYKK